MPKYKPQNSKPTIGSQCLELEVSLPFLIVLIVYVVDRLTLLNHLPSDVLLTLRAVFIGCSCLVLSCSLHIKNICPRHRYLHYSDWFKISQLFELLHVADRVKNVCSEGPEQQLMATERRVPFWEQEFRNSGVD